MFFKSRASNPSHATPIDQAAPATTAPPFPIDGPSGTERATFAAGCFWGIEASFREIEGVARTAVGYTGGHTSKPTYEQVCGHGTGHAEAVEVWFDPAQVSYEELLAHFWRMHNPTTRDRQGLDIGNQYRSAIFFHTPEQRVAASASCEREQADRRRRIVTEIVPASAFYRAEEYHQRYFEKSGRTMCALTLR
jgi:peptide-methionine (S)-S-oxide reductase